MIYGYIDVHNYYYTKLKVKNLHLNRNVCLWCCHTSHTLWRATEAEANV